MTAQHGILTRLNHAGLARVAYLPDLTLCTGGTRAAAPCRMRGEIIRWLRWQRLSASARWVTVQPWRVEHTGISVLTEKDQEQRIIRYETPAGRSRHAGPSAPTATGGRQSIRSRRSGFAAAREVVAARHYVVEPGRSALQPGTDDAAAGDDTQYRTSTTQRILALELPMRPYSDLLHTMLGWGEGLMLLMGEGGRCWWRCWGCWRISWQRWWIRSPACRATSC